MASSYSSSDAEQDLSEECEDETELFERECDEFIQDFVNKIFSPSEQISQELKAKFGVVCQHSCGRHSFSKHIDAQRVYCKSVDEITFYRLIQFFAVVLFEFIVQIHWIYLPSTPMSHAGLALVCKIFKLSYSRLRCHQADDFAPAKNLMNMCFTFYHELNLGDEVDTPHKEFLTAYLRSQPIWQSMRYWNAAFFDALHCEKEVPVISSKEWDSWTCQEQLDYQECDKNSLFGKLGAFVSNMKAFGLDRDMCLQFLHKMSTIGELDKGIQDDTRTTIKNGFAEKVFPANKAKKAWYIPHHGVYYPKKTNKIHIVFDCAAEYNNDSLNKHLLQGPDLTNNLIGVLCRFRQESTAFVCDIKAMFHQVKVNTEHRDLLRFLWWEDGDTSRDPSEYLMTVHLFGTTSSPGCANFALKTLANDYEKENGTAAANFLRNDFYVDDGLKSTASTEETVKLISDVKQMCKNGGFKLHKFVSNDKEVIRSTNEEDRVDTIKNIDLDLDSLPIERALGIHWCTETDCFRFDIVLLDKLSTRRGILSTISSMFDPLGFVVPIFLERKAIPQELCRDNVGWDDPISENVKGRWAAWREQVKRVQAVTILRCYKPKECGSIARIGLHHFSDASVKGYGQCSYLRLIDHGQGIHCGLVMGKSRVAPLKPVTIPRLELTAAVCSVRVSQQLQQELEYPVDEEIFWTDSSVALGYINNQSRRFHVYVANRGQEIQDNTSAKQWRYVESNTALIRNTCDWFVFEMNLPSASHMGGVWERSILSSLLADNREQLDEESLRTLMCEAEVIVNSRPLTTDQLGDPDAPCSLTPNHLLTMKSKIVLAPPGCFSSADVYCRKRWRRVHPSPMNSGLMEKRLLTQSAAASEVDTPNKEHAPWPCCNNKGPESTKKPLAVSPCVSSLPKC